MQAGFEQSGIHAALGLKMNSSFLCDRCLQAAVMRKPHLDSEGNSQRANQSETVLGASHSGQREAQGDGMQVIQVSSALSPYL